MEISPHTLAQFLYGFDEFFGCRPASIHPSDYPSFKVYIVPHEIGVNIRNSDPEETMFHVEFYPPDRAELWHTLAWRDSLTRRLRIAGQVSTYYQTPQESVRSSLDRRLIAHFKSLHFPFRHARALTEMLISGPESPHVYDLAVLPPEIIHDLKQYRSKDSSQSPRSGPGTDAQDPVGPTAAENMG